MAQHPLNIVIQIVGTDMDDQGRSCEEHDCCNPVLEEDVVVRLRRVQLLVQGCEETAIAVVWVTNGVDGCPVDFLKRNMVKHAKCSYGALAQVTKVLSADACYCNLAERRLHHHNKGCSFATIIFHLPAVKFNWKLKEEGNVNNNVDKIKRGEMPNKRLKDCINSE